MLVCGICRVRLTVVPSRWQLPQRRGISIVEVGEPGLERAQDVVGAVTRLAAGSGGVAAGGLPAVHARGVLLLLVAVALAAVDAGQLLGMRQLP